jgi:hypothetical protein
MINSALACEEKIIKHEKRELKLCFDKATHSYYSKNCKKSDSCISVSNLKFVFYANQSPGFSICHQLKGKPFHAVVNGVRESFCEKDDKVVDTESLLRAYHGKK